MIKEIKDKTLPGMGETDAEIKANFMLHYVWELADAVAFDNPIVEAFFDFDSEKDLQHKADVLERVYKGNDVSDEELISILELYPKPKDGLKLVVKW